jgi:hypothetical protein
MIEGYYVSKDTKIVVLDDSKNLLYEGKLKELTVYDLFDKNNIAPSTMDYRSERNKIVGTENITAKFIDCFINQADKSITFAFQTKATILSKNKQNSMEDEGKISGKQNYWTSKKRVQPLKLDKILKNPEKTYEIQFKILDFFDWLDVFEGEKITNKEIKEILEVSDIQLFNTSPSWQYQGYNFWNSELGTSAYPTKIAPKVWDKRFGGEYFLDKHTYGLIRSIKFFFNPMASMLTKKLKDRNLI